MLREANGGLIGLSLRARQVRFLAAHRSRVCDCCFFGGPTRTAPLAP